ncbi:MAG: hypothetical protein Q4C89_01375 [Deinococcus sp.]|uniref:hypothetical protein n=1 Tax=Deinococcus sp. TaxID=47478 RepID=UPI0026DD9F66|nr:hypothetical protein [Deinococcus sp.]MDO4244659.1 hypothetical protein [Deinococcus sp.]
MITSTLYAPVNAPTPEAPALPRLLRPQELHKATGIPSAVIYAALSSGELRGLDISRPPRPGKEPRPLWMVDPADFADWLEKRKARQAVHVHGGK